jgi:ribosomal protein L11 methyltransferase
MKKELATKRSDSRDGSMKRWLAVSVLVPRGFGEAVSNFLIEEGASGIEEVDEDLRWIRLKTYFQQDGKEKRVLRSLDRYLKSLRMMNPEISNTPVKTTTLLEQDWGENWKRFFGPVQVTSRFIVKPPWSSIQLKKGQISIDITPGMAFGTGTHATTKLCIRALEKRLKKTGLSVLDVGTGSGILSIAAARLGAGEVMGVDTDRVSVKIAKENVSRNGVTGMVKIRKGSIGDIQKRFDVVVANIDLRRLRRMRRPLLGHLKSRGFLILSGILEGEGDSLRQYYMETGLLGWAEITREGEWVCLTFQKK